MSLFHLLLRTWGCVSWEARSSVLEKERWLWGKWRTILSSLTSRRWWWGVTGRMGNLNWEYKLDVFWLFNKTTPSEPHIHVKCTKYHNFITIGRTIGRSHRGVFMFCCLCCMSCCTIPPSITITIVILYPLALLSLTWTDAHLHRQLVMVMSGPVVESFDREFRILYANSLPIPDTWKAGRPIGAPMTDGSVTMHRPKRLDVDSSKPLMMESNVSPPPSFTGQTIDWEALGVVQKGPDFAGFFPEPGQCYGPIFDEPLVIEEKPIPQQYVPQSNLVLPQEDRYSRRPFFLQSCHAITLSMSVNLSVQSFMVMCLRIYIKTNMLTQPCL